MKWTPGVGVFLMAISLVLKDKMFSRYEDFSPHKKHVATMLQVKPCTSKLLQCLHFEFVGIVLKQMEIYTILCFSTWVFVSNLGLLDILHGLKNFKNFCHPFYFYNPTIDWFSN